MILTIELVSIIESVTKRGLKMATILYANGEIKEVSPVNGTDFQLKEVQAIVGGYVEVVYLKDGRIMIVNEEGKLDGLPCNEQATKLAELPTEAEWEEYIKKVEEAGVAVIDARMEGEDYIAGDVLVCENREFR
jgi:uncharacterized protein DUF3846